MPQPSRTRLARNNADRQRMLERSGFLSFSSRCVIRFWLRETYLGQLVLWLHGPANNTCLFRFSPKLWMQISPPFSCRFIFFHGDSMSVGICILANACDHPRYLHVRL